MIKICNQVQSFIAPNLRRYMSATLTDEMLLNTDLPLSLQKESFSGFPKGNPVRL